MNVNATRSAPRSPSIAGIDFNPKRRSPSMLLKSLSVMRPCEPSEYSEANTTVPVVTWPNAAAPAIQAQPS